MRPIRLRLRKISVPEDGFTVLELTVTMTVMTVVIVSLLGVFMSAQRSQAFASDRSQTIDDIRVAMNRITKEVRQASRIDPASTSSNLTMQTFVDGVSQTVTWRVNVPALRLERVDAAGNVVPVLQRLVLTSPFTYSPSAAEPVVVLVRLRARPRTSPGTVLELQSELQLRNREVTL